MNEMWYSLATQVTFVVLLQPEKKPSKVCFLVTNSITHRPKNSNETKSDHEGNNCKIIYNMHNMHR